MNVCCQFAGSIFFAFCNLNQTFSVSGDADGFARLFRYPASSSTAEFVERRAAGGGVAAVRFLFDDIYVVAAVGGGGGEGRDGRGVGQPAIVRWKIK